MSEVITYGAGGYDPAKPQGNVVSTRAITIPVRQVNEEDVRAKARTALAVNAVHLARPAPTVAQNTAQVKALTRQMNGLIRLLLDELQDVSDT